VSTPWSTQVKRGELHEVHPDAGRNGNTVYTAGSAAPTGFAEVVAYNAATGATIWKYHFDTSFRYAAQFNSVTVSPDGSTVFVAGGTQTSADNGFHQAILAFNATTGAELWELVSPAAASANSPIAVSPDSSAVYVTNGGLGQTTAYNAATGAVLWTAPIGGGLGKSYTASLSGVTATASAVVVSTTFDNAKYSRPHWQTVALNPATGATLWSRGQYGPGGQAFGSALALSPNGATVYVTGWVSPTSPGYNMLTNGYDIATGATTWNARFHGKANSFAYAIAVSPNGSQVFVTGTDGGMPTIGYAASDLSVTDPGALPVRQRPLPGHGPGKSFTRGLSSDPVPRASHECHPPAQHAGTARRNFMKFIRMLAVAATAVAVAGLGSAAAASASTPPATRQWTASFVFKHEDVGGQAVATSPDGGTVYVIGDADFGELVAYNAATGAVIWQDHFDINTRFGASFGSIAVSPDGSTVFVTGAAGLVDNGDYQATVAYNATTGAKLWQVIGTTVVGGLSPVAVSPDSSTVYVTNAGLDQTVAYNAATGAARWTKPSGGDALALAADGGTLFLTGEPGGATQALNAATGAADWTASASGTAAALSPGGTTLFVSGVQTSGGTASIVTAAIASSTGSQLWSAVTGPPHIYKLNGLAATGSAVIVNATVSHAKDKLAWQTVVMAPATGATLWTRAQTGAQGFANATGLVLSPDGATAYVTGYVGATSGGENMLTNGYNTSTGAKTWTARYSGRVNNFAYAVGISPDGSQVFVTGTSAPVSGAQGIMTTVAYSTS
jgi:outer membrane protein assembly factor BamB